MVGPPSSWSLADHEETGVRLGCNSSAHPPVLILQAFRLTTGASDRSGPRSGGEMLFKSSAALLVAWLLGLFIPFGVGDLVHVLLLAGLMLSLLSFAKTRDAAVRRSREDDEGQR